MLSDVVDLLACPYCGGGMTLRDSVVRCAGGHAFDIARQGYLNLLHGDARTGTADTAAMVAARTAALAGPLAPLVEHVAHTAGTTAPAVDGCVLDLGAGTGRHLACVLDRLPTRRGLALDLSKHAARRAARAHPRLGAVVCDAWRRLPVRDAVAAQALSIFAPRNAGELARVLAPGAELLVVTPTVHHLSQLVAALELVTVEAGKVERLERMLAGHFALTGHHTFGYDAAMDAGDITAIVGMGPSARHAAPEVLSERIAALDVPLPVTVHVRLARYRRLRSGGR